MTCRTAAKTRRFVAVACAVLGLGAPAQAQVVDPFDPGASGKVAAIAVQADGRILVGGSFSRLGGGGTGTTQRQNIARLNADGSLDASFNPGSNGVVLALAVQADGKIVVGGSFTSLGGAVRNNLARLHPDGSLDAAFNPGSSGSIFAGEVDAVAIQPDGKILVGGEFLALGGGTGTTPRSRIGRLNADGSVDAAFNPGANEAVISIAVQPDLKIVVGGVFTTLGGAIRNRIGRLNANGSVDTSFNPGTSSNVVTAVALQADGKILLGGNFTGLGGGTGTTPRSRIGRLHADGSVDAGFNPGATGSIVYTIVVQADGKILVGGLFTGLGNGGTTPRRNIGRLGPDGSIDVSFDPGANGTVEGLLIQPDGSILVGGPFTALGGGTGTTARNHIGRLTNTDAPTQNLSYSGGVVTWLRGGSAPEVARVTFDASTNGVTYTPLGTATRATGGWRLTGQTIPNSRNLTIRARGYYIGGYENASTSVAEFVANVFVAPTTGDVDGDRKADVTVYRPSTGSWYSLTSSSGFTGGVGYAWGAVGDVPVPGDYDGDRKTDIAVYRPSAAYWFILKSTTNFTTWYTFQWGATGDVPVPSDYDGDGSTDVAIYRPSNGTWYILTSSSGFTVGAGYVWGAAGDVAIPGDYDGDGRADIAVYRPSAAYWFILKSTTTYTAWDTYQWGTTGDLAVPADYDGDGRTDVAIYRPSSGAWYILTSASGFTAGAGYAWGAAGDVPVPGDYDGDGKADIAVYRPSAAYWFILKSTTSYTAWDTYQWGTTGDIPILGRQ